MTPLALQSPDFPQELEYVWSYFLSLNEGRGATQVGAAPLTYSDIKAWAELTGNILTPFEVDCIKRLDRKYMKVINERSS
jgi:hypothetical protein